MTKITNVEVIRLKAKQPSSPNYTWDQPVARPYDKYPESLYDKENWMAIGAGEVVVKITCDEGVYGLGSVGGYKLVPGDIVERQLKPLLIGKNPLQITKLWDAMFQTTIPVGRKGAAIEAISAVDIALWDLFGKLAGQPVYQLLGGRVRDDIPVYCTGSDYEYHKSIGCPNTKIPLPYGAIAGPDGLRKNVEYITKVREILGPDADIMIDCWMSLDLEYAIKLARAIEHLDIRWIEEPFIADNYDDYRRLRDILNPMGILVTGGEHEFTLYGVRDLIEKGCVDIIQTDIWRAGGVTELKNITAYASAHHMKVIPHDHGGAGPAALHVTLNSVNSPFAEVLMRNPDTSVFTNQPRPKNGVINVTNGPGFDYEINPDFGDIVD